MLCACIFGCIVVSLPFIEHQFYLIPVFSRYTKSNVQQSKKHDIFVLVETSSTNLCFILETMEVNKIRRKLIAMNIDETTVSSVLWCKHGSKNTLIIIIFQLEDHQSKCCMFFTLVWIIKNKVWVLTNRAMW